MESVLIIVDVYWGGRTGMKGQGGLGAQSAIGTV